MTVTAHATPPEREASVLPNADDEKTFGFWVYLMSDAVIFALLFATYAVLSGNYAGGPTGKELFALSRTFIESMFLLASSATFGFATFAMMSRNRGGVLLWLALTFVLGLGFVVMEISEFHGMIAATVPSGW